MDAEEPRAASDAWAGGEPERVFDDLARLAASVTRCDRSAIMFVDGPHTCSPPAPRLPAAVVRGARTPAHETFCYAAVEANAPFVVRDATTDPRTARHPAVASHGIGAWAAFPIVTTDGRPIGSMCVVDDEPRDWTGADLESLAALARAVSNEVSLRTLLDSARTALRDSEDALAKSRELSRSLQDSLLPPHLRPVPGVETAARYLPASGDVTVVGDFYDLFHTRGPWWTAVLGDVCGKGTEAAKVTALARYTVRADAGEHLSPSVVLERLNTAMLAQKAPRFLTAVQSTFRVTDAGVAGRLCLAGHPPALIRRAHGAVHQVGEPGTLLGVLEQVSLNDVRFRLAPGDLLLLYTDGACEARPDPRGTRKRPTFDEAALSRTLGSSGDMDAESTVEYVSAVLAEHNDGWASDDTALLALRVPGRR